MFYDIGNLKHLQNSQIKPLSKSFFNKVTGIQPPSLSNLQNFPEYPLYKTPSDN